MAKNKQRIKRVMEMTPKEKAIGQYELVSPIVDGGEKINTLYFRKPTVADLRIIEESALDSQTEGNVAVISCLTGVLPEAIDRLDLEDYESLKKNLPDFLSETAWDAIREAMEFGMAASMMSSGMGSLATGKNG